MENLGTIVENNRAVVKVSERGGHLCSVKIGERFKFGTENTKMITPTTSDKVAKTVAKDNKRRKLPMDFAKNRYEY